MPSATTKAKTNGRPGPKHNIDAMREAFYERISKRDMAPLWKRMSSVVAKEPATRCVPHVWHYDDVKSLVMESGGLISAEEALRRVLILENPAMRGESKATNTLFAGIQMILPGEVAPAHRHVSSAIRFVLDGEGAYTAVEGEKAFMAPGDFVITANWAPHDHGNPSKKPMLWLDVLDARRSTSSRRRSPTISTKKMQNTTRGDGNSLAFYGSGVLPDGAPTTLNRSPIINYTYARTRPILDRLKKAGDIDRSHGARVHYVNPVNGGPVLPTMGAQLALAPEGLQGREVPCHRRHHLCLHRRRRHDDRRGQGAGMGRQRRVRGAALEALFAPDVQGLGAVFDLRPASAAGARHLAGGAERGLDHDVPADWRSAIRQSLE